MPAARSSASAARSRRSASGCDPWLRVALRADQQEARRRLGGALADAVEQRLADDGLVRDHEHVLLAARRLLDDDVLDGDVAGDRADSIEGVAAQPTRLLQRVGRDDDLVRRLVELVELVADGIGRVALHDHPVCSDPRLAEAGERAVEPAPRRRAAGVLVDDVALPGRVHRAEHRDVDLTLGRAAAQRVDQRLAADGLVRHDQDSWSVSRLLELAGGLTGQDGVARPRHAVLVRAADHLRDLVEVEERRRRGDLPLERQSRATGCPARVGRAPSC